jgi:hypothetical protein
MSTNTTYSKDYVMQYGVAPNPQENVTVGQAENMAAVWRNLAKVEGVYVNTVMEGLNASRFIELGDVSPALSPTDVLFLQVMLVVKDWEKVEGDAETRNMYAVCQWESAVKAIGMQMAAKERLDRIQPGWMADWGLVVKVAGLPGLSTPPPYTPPPVHDRPAPEDTGVESPDWTNPVGDGWLGVRPNDHSPIGTEYKDATHGSWVKAGEPSLFGYSNVRWEQSPIAG